MWSDTTSAIDHIESYSYSLKVMKNGHEKCSSRKFFFLSLPIFVILCKGIHAFLNVAWLWTIGGTVTENVGQTTFVKRSLFLKVIHQSCIHIQRCHDSNKLGSVCFLLKVIRNVKNANYFNSGKKKHFQIKWIYQNENSTQNEQEQLCLLNQIQESLLSTLFHAGITQRCIWPSFSKMVEAIVLCFSWRFTSVFIHNAFGNHAPQLVTTVVFNKYLWQQTERAEENGNQQWANVSVHFSWDCVNALFSFRIDAFPLHFSCTSLCPLFSSALSNTFFVLAVCFCVCSHSVSSEPEGANGCVKLCRYWYRVYSQALCLFEEM